MVVAIIAPELLWFATFDTLVATQCDLRTIGLEASVTLELAIAHAERPFTGYKPHVSMQRDFGREVFTAFMAYVHFFALCVARCAEGTKILGIVTALVICNIRINETKR